MSNREHILVYTPADLDPALTSMLPGDAGPRRCLFWIAREGSAAIEGLMAAVPEPSIDHVEAGMALASLVPRLAARGRALADLVRPDEVPPDRPLYLGTYSMGFHTGDAATVRAFLAERAELVPVSRAFESMLVMRTGVFEGVTAWRPELVTPEAVDGWLVLENPRFPMLICAEGGKARIDSRPPKGFAAVPLVLPIVDPTALETTGAITEPRAAALVDEVFSSQRFFRVLDGELAPSLLFTTDDVHRGRREVVVLALRDGRIDSLGQENVRLLPERPISERLYWDFLTATRAVVECRDHGHRLPSRILDIELLDAPELATFEDFCAVVLDEDATARVLAPIGLARLLPGAPPLADPATLWRALPQVAHARKLAVRKDELVGLPREHLTLLAEAWATRALEIGAVDPIADEVLGALHEALGREAVHAAAERARARLQGTD